jgi:haloalkane dehalogenase
MTDQPAISADFPFESHFVEVHGSKMHYVDEGSGAPILFLHGNPTSSYLWRNIIPHLTDKGRCIAPDLIGMGKSDKPDIDYRFFDHMKYIDGFIEALDLKNITLVIHDWGSALGFHYAMRHPENIKGIAFMEAIVKPMNWSEFGGLMSVAFRAMRTPLVGWFMVSGLNMFVNGMLPGAVVRDLSDEEMAHYREPYPTRSSRKPVLQWPREVPIDGKPADVHRTVSEYSQKLQASDIPKLMLTAKPGAILPPEKAAWCQEHFPNLRTVDLGKGTHFVQEDHPHKIGEGIADWLSSLD